MENDMNAEVKKMYEMQVSFLEAIRDHGLAKTMLTISKADPTELGGEALGAVWVTLLSLYLPELLSNEEFPKILGDIMDEKDDISERVNPTIDNLKKYISAL